MSTALTKPNLSDEKKTLSVILRNPQYADRFKEVLKDNAPQFISSLIQVGRSLGDDCEPMSIVGSAMIAAALNLPIDKNLGFAWIVPYKSKGQKIAQFTMGYKGYVQLALRTGQYKRLNVCQVYEGELQGQDKLTGDLSIDPSKRTSDKVVGYASYMKLVSGFEHAEYWSIETVKAHATRYSQSFRGGYDSPWKTNFDQMAMKTVLSSHIRHWGPMTIEVAKAHNADSAVIKDIDAEPDYVDNVMIEQKPNLLEDEPNNTPAAGTNPQVSLGDLMSDSGVPYDLLVAFINVNGIDKKHNIDVTSFSEIGEWPSAFCAEILNDKILIKRITDKFGKK